MKQLLWKEWQERRIWLLLWAVAEVGVGVFAHTQSPFGSFEPNGSTWILLPGALALLAGLGAYGSELAGGRAAFLYTRALSWKQVLLAKLLPGVAVLVGAPFISACILRLSAHAPYTHFMTPVNLLSGALWMMSFTGMAFFAGFGCSIVLSGLAGSILVLFGFFGAVFLGSTLLAKVSGYPSEVFLGYIVTPLLAVVVLARFGITLSPGARLRRFALAVLIPLIIISSAGFLPALRKNNRLAERIVSVQIVSPSGESAFARRWYDAWKGYWFDLRNKRLLPLPENQFFLAWASNECLITQTIDPVTGKISDGCLLTWLDHGQLRSHRFESGGTRHPYASPDGQKVLLLTGKDFCVFDLRTGTTQRFPVTWPNNSKASKEGADCWWQSNDVIGYTDPTTGQPVLKKLAQ